MRSGSKNEERRVQIWIEGQRTQTKIWIWIEDGAGVLLPSVVLVVYKREE